MVHNAASAFDRLRTIFYLCHSRYDVSAKEAGERLAQELTNNQLCKQTMTELRTELASPSKDLGIAGISDADVRLYLLELLNSFDQARNLGPEQ